MDWYSERVSKGGIFQPAKVNYSPETKKFLQDLMEESKLTMLQREKINYSLRSGDPLPSVLQTKPRTSAVTKKPDIVIRPGSSKRRQFSTIKESGAYEKEKFVPKTRGVDREYAKKHLQDFMAFGKEIKDDPKPVKRRDEPMVERNRFDEYAQLFVEDE